MNFDSILDSCLNSAASSIPTNLLDSLLPQGMGGGPFMPAGPSMMGVGGLPYPGQNALPSGMNSSGSAGLSSISSFATPPGLGAASGLGSSSFGPPNPFGTPMFNGAPDPMASIPTPNMFPSLNSCIGPRPDMLESSSCQYSMFGIPSQPAGPSFPTSGSQIFRPPAPPPSSNMLAGSMSVNPLSGLDMIGQNGLTRSPIADSLTPSVIREHRSPHNSSSINHSSPFQAPTLSRPYSPPVFDPSHTNSGFTRHSSPFGPQPNIQQPMSGMQQLHSTSLPPDAGPGGWPRMLSPAKPVSSSGQTMSSSVTHRALQNLAEMNPPISASDIQRHNTWSMDCAPPSRPNNDGNLSRNSPHYTQPKSASQHPQSQYPSRSNMEYMQSRSSGHHMTQVPPKSSHPSQHPHSHTSSSSQARPNPAHMRAPLQVRSPLTSHQPHPKDSRMNFVLSHTKPGPHMRLQRPPVPNVQRPPVQRNSSSMSSHVHNTSRVSSMSNHAQPHMSKSGSRGSNGNVISQQVIKREKLMERKDDRVANPSQSSRNRDSMMSLPRDSNTDYSQYTGTSVPPIVIAPMEEPEHRMAECQPRSERSGSGDRRHISERTSGDRRSSSDRSSNSSRNSTPGRAESRGRSSSMDKNKGGSDSSTIQEKPTIPAEVMKLIQSAADAKARAEREEKQKAQDKERQKGIPAEVMRLIESAKLAKDNAIAADKEKVALVSKGSDVRSSSASPRTDSIKSERRHSASSEGRHSKNMSGNHSSRGSSPMEPPSKPTQRDVKPVRLPDGSLRMPVKSSQSPAACSFSHLSNSRPNAPNVPRMSKPQQNPNFRFPRPPMDPMYRSGGPHDPRMSLPGQHPDPRMLRPGGHTDPRMLRPGGHTDPRMLRPGGHTDPRMLRPGGQQVPRMLRPGGHTDPRILRPGGHPDPRMLRPGGHPDPRMLRPGGHPDPRMLQPGGHQVPRMLRPGEHPDPRMLLPGGHADPRMLHPGEKPDPRMLQPGADMHPSLRMSQSGGPTEPRMLQPGGPPDLRMFPPSRHPDQRMFQEYAASDPRMLSPGGSMFNPMSIPGAPMDPRMFMPGGFMDSRMVRPGEPLDPGIPGSSGESDPSMQKPNGHPHPRPLSSDGPTAPKMLRPDRPPDFEGMRPSGPTDTTVLRPNGPMENILARPKPDLRPFMPFGPLMNPSIVETMLSPRGPTECSTLRQDAPMQCGIAQSNDGTSASAETMNQGMVMAETPSEPKNISSEPLEPKVQVPLHFQLPPTSMITDFKIPTSAGMGTPRHCSAGSFSEEAILEQCLGTPSPVGSGNRTPQHLTSPPPMPSPVRAVSRSSAYDDATPQASLSRPDEMISPQLMCPPGISSQGLPLPLPQTLPLPYPGDQTLGHQPQPSSIQPLVPTTLASMINPILDMIDRFKDSADSHPSPQELQPSPISVNTSQPLQSCLISPVLYENYSQSNEPPPTMAEFMGMRTQPDMVQLEQLYSVPVTTQSTTSFQFAQDKNYNTGNANIYSSSPNLHMHGPMQQKNPGPSSFMQELSSILGKKPDDISTDGYSSGREVDDISDIIHSATAILHGGAAPKIPSDHMSLQENEFVDSMDTAADQVEHMDMELALPQKEKKAPARKPKTPRKPRMKKTCDKKRKAPTGGKGRKAKIAVPDAKLQMRPIVLMKLLAPKWLQQLDSKGFASLNQPNPRSKRKPDYQRGPPRKKQKSPDSDFTAGDELLEQDLDDMTDDVPPKADSDSDWEYEGDDCAFGWSGGKRKNAARMSSDFSSSEETEVSHDSDSADSDGLDLEGEEPSPEKFEKMARVRQACLDKLKRKRQERRKLQAVTDAGEKVSEDEVVDQIPEVPSPDSPPGPRFNRIESSDLNSEDDPEPDANKMDKPEESDVSKDLKISPVKTCERGNSRKRGRARGRSRGRGRRGLYKSESEIQKEGTLKKKAPGRQTVRSLSGSSGYAGTPEGEKDLYQLRHLCSKSYAEYLFEDPATISHRHLKACLPMMCIDAYLSEAEQKSQGLCRVKTRLWHSENKPSDWPCDLLYADPSKCLQPNCRQRCSPCNYMKLHDMVAIFNFLKKRLLSQVDKQKEENSATLPSETEVVKNDVTSQLTDSCGDTDTFRDSKVCNKSDTNNCSTNCDDKSSEHTNNKNLDPSMEEDTDTDEYSTKDYLSPPNLLDRVDDTQEQVGTCHGSDAAGTEIPNHGDDESFSSVNAETPGEKSRNSSVLSDIPVEYTGTKMDRSIDDADTESLSCSSGEEVYEEPSGHGQDRSVEPRITREKQAFVEDDVDDDHSKEQRLVCGDHSEESRDHQGESYHHHSTSDDQHAGSHDHSTSHDQHAGSHDHSTSDDQHAGSHDHSTSHDQHTGSHDHSASHDQHAGSHDSNIGESHSQHTETPESPDSESHDQIAELPDLNNHHAESKDEGSPEQYVESPESESHDQHIESHDQHVESPDSPESESHDHHIESHDQLVDLPNSPESESHDQHGESHYQHGESPDSPDSESHDHHNESHNHHSKSPNQHVESPDSPESESHDPNGESPNSPDSESHDHHSKPHDQHLESPDSPGSESHDHHGESPESPESESHDHHGESPESPESESHDHHDESPKSPESESHDHHGESPDSPGSESHDHHGESPDSPGSESHDHHGESPESPESESHDHHGDSPDSPESESHDHHGDSPDSPESESHDQHDESHDHHSKSHDQHVESPDSPDSQPHDQYSESHYDHSVSNDHHSEPHDHHSESHNHHSESHDHHSESHDYHSEPHDHHSESHDHHSESHDHHSESHDHCNSPTYLHKTLPCQPAESGYQHGQAHDQQDESQLWRSQDQYEQHAQTRTKDGSSCESQVDAPSSPANNMTPTNSTPASTDTYERNEDFER